MTTITAIPSMTAATANAAATQDADDMADPFATTPEEAEIGRLRFQVRTLTAKLAASERRESIFRDALQEFASGKIVNGATWAQGSLLLADRFCIYCGTGAEDMTGKGSLMPVAVPVNAPQAWAHSRCEEDFEHEQEWESHRDYD